MTHRTMGHQEPLELEYSLVSKQESYQIGLSANTKLHYWSIQRKNHIMRQKLLTLLRISSLGSIAPLLGVALLLISQAAIAKAPRSKLNPTNGGQPSPPALVLPSLIKQVIHDKGNIATTVDNWGLIGSYSFISEQDFPSCEWPRNSQHSYLAEIKYWMGAVTMAGDTLVSNTLDDFQPQSSFATGENAYDILFSTDSTSYNYDPTDTVGTGRGSSAFGWRVWNNDSAAWVYDQVYSPSDSTFGPAGPVAIQESHYRFNDGARGFNLLGLEMTQTIYQWNFCYNENFLFVALDIKNASTTDYSNFAFGVYCDWDVGGYDPATGENGRLNDMVDYDTSKNLAWTYDVTGYDAGWRANTGVMGTKYLRTPDNLGMSALRTGLWDLLPNKPEEDAARYTWIDKQQFDTPLAPDDQFYIMCTNGIDLPAGKTIQVVYAIVAGKDEAEFRNNADLAQSLFDGFFVGPEPPPTPTLTVTEGAGRNILSWDNVAETFVDPLSGKQDFQGYKLYRSTNLGSTWGREDRTGATSCQSIEYETIATFRVSSPGEPVAHSFVDTTVLNGYEYWYCLAAFDSGDPTVPVDPLQNAFGTPGKDANVVKAVPNTNPAGFVSAQSTVSRNTPADSSAGTIWPIVLDPTSAGSNVHKIAFTEDDFATYWSLIDTVTGDTLLSNQTTQFTSMNQSAADSLVSFFPIANGLQVAVFNGEMSPTQMTQTGFATPGDTSLTMGTFLGTTVVDAFGFPPSALGGDKHFRMDYEIRFTGTNSFATSALDDVTPVSVPFEVWNVTTNQQCFVEIFDFAGNGVYDASDGDFIDILNFPYDVVAHPEAFPTYHTWMFRFDTSAASAQPGDVYRISGAPLNGPQDEFYFSPDGINLSLAAGQLKDIKVVPNPYFARAQWENSNSPTKVNFTHLPKQSTIRVYTLSGDLVKVIEHNSGGGDASWDLLSLNGQQVASGIYFYHVESSAGEFVGRFAVIN